MGKFLEHDHACQNRPLLDDAVFLKGWHRSGNGEFRQIAMETAESPSFRSLTPDGSADWT